jgi:hypothetical protein
MALSPNLLGLAKKTRRASCRALHEKIEDTRVGPAANPALLADEEGELVAFAGILRFLTSIPVPDASIA